MQRSFFEQYDAGVTRRPLECRHPLLDLRLVEFCLSLPPQPWCVKKHILRAAMRGVLPEPVRLRPKTPLAQWPGAKLLERADSRWVDEFVPTPSLERFVERGKIPRCAKHDPEEAWINMRPLSLNIWLHQLNTSDTQKGFRHESPRQDQAA